MATIGELLKTGDPEEQVKTVQELIQFAGLPTLTLLLSVDLRSGVQEVRYLGPQNPPFNELYAMLDSARKHLMEKERAALLKTEKTSEE